MISFAAPGVIDWTLILLVTAAAGGMFVALVGLGLVLYRRHTHLAAVVAMLLALGALASGITLCLASAILAFLHSTGGG
ncbi:MAG TPA: hypothetical protein EYP04_05980 [Anaerolineae bacterium]|nr:hypothetical protein [Anaerolineae bacterium]HIQ04579.1 hypothetical protein [Anaerolineae bacterium]